MRFSSRTRQWIAISLVIVALIGVGVYKKTHPKLATVTIADAQQPVFALLYIADERGYFRDEGLDVVFNKFTLGKDALNDVISGNSDLAVVYETPFVARSFEGNDIGIVTALHKSSRNTALIGRKDRGIYSINNIWGKRIGVSKGTNAEFFLDSLLTSEGIGLSAVTIMHVPAEQSAEALKRGDVDAIAVFAVPQYLQDEQIAKMSSVVYSDIYTEISLLAGMREYIQSNPDTIKKILMALLRAEEYYETNRNEAIELIANRLEGYSTTTVKAVLDTVTVRAQLDNVLLTILNQEAGWYRREGIYTVPVPEFRAAIMGQYLYEVQPTAVTVN